MCVSPGQLVFTALKNFLSVKKNENLETEQSEYVQNKIKTAQNVSCLAGGLRSQILL